MLDLLSRLTAIKYYAKDIHYNAKGEQFYAVHLLMDRVADGLDTFSDTIKEVCYMGAGDEPPSSKEILKIAVDYIPYLGDDNKESLMFLGNLLLQALERLDSIKSTNKADTSVFDAIAQDLKLKYGLIEHCL